MTQKMSYILIGDDRGRNFTNKDIDILNPNKLLLSGLYLWSTAFNLYGKEGTIDTFWRKDDLEDYDIVHINYTPSNIQLPTVIRNELGTGSSTKLVINVDLDVKHWGVNFAYNLNDMVRELRLADVLFHVESVGAMILNHLLDRKIHVNPHPVDVSGLYDYIQKEREPMISTIFHRYTSDTMMPYIAQRKIPMRRVLFGYTPTGKHSNVANAGMFDQILPYQPFSEHIPELAKSALGCDLYSGYSYGRAVVEFAALGIPCVCSSTIDASHRLFPFTKVNPFDTEDAENKFNALIKHTQFTDDVILKAHAECKYYSLENSYKRFVEMME